ncbi:AMP-binding protein [Sphingomonas sp.]|uniref:class I adenylate-forming enzyme family protein n=1 Tax=Sphingomonas sp. TaxID=28214 RepID=UPI00286A41E9|nr:AMP-binding protein [Sphingomonas sp.]
MYRVSLTESLFPAVRDAPVEKLTIGDLLRRRATAHAATIALKEFGYDGAVGRTWTYAGLLRDAERLARALASRHKPGTRIAIYANNLPEWVLMEFATAMAGIILVTVNPAFQARELKYVLEQSRSEAIYYVAEFRGSPMTAIANEACDEVPAIRRRIELTDHAALFDGEDRGVLPQVTPDDVTQIQYTSGTTGFPKGALLHHHGLIQNARDCMVRLGLGAGDSFMHNMPLFHTTGCAICVLGIIDAGATMLLAPIFDPVMIVRVIERERPGYLLGVPTMLVALVDEAVRSGRDVSSFQRIMSGGAMVAPELINRVRAAFGPTVQIVYGQTECSPVITMVWHDDVLADLTGTIGQPLPNLDVAILDLQTAAVMPIGEQGEICTRGYHVMTGYNDNPEATAKAIDADGWLHTGDLGRMDARGYVTITGRVKEMIIRGGENLFPAEIENAMLEHDDVGEVAVIGVPCPVYGEQVACFMRASGERRPDPAELKAFIRARLSPQKTPKHWLWVDQWPLTGSGKIQKFKLAEQFAAGEHREAEGERVS